MIGEFTLIDFHNHHVPARFELTAARTQPATQRARWEMLTHKLADEDLLVRDIRGPLSRARRQYSGQLDCGCGRARAA